MKAPCEEPKTEKVKPDKSLPAAKSDKVEVD